nr:MAG TPA: hypothetical protein [Bacteriophage sp.]
MCLYYLTRGLQYQSYIKIFELLYFFIITNTISLSNRYE